MKKGDLLRVTITDISNEGNGIARDTHDSDSHNRVIFVKNATIGDEVICEITKLKKNYAIAEARDIISLSPYRKPKKEVCPHITDGCGGCNIGCLTYTKQLELKSERVKNALTRIGGFSLEEDEIIFEDIVPSYNEYAYRNKAVFSVAGSKIGFLKPKSREVVECSQCKIVMPEILNAVLGLSEFLETYPQYSDKIERFMVRAGDDGHVMAVIFGSPSEIEHMQELANFISDKCELVSLYGVNLIHDKSQPNGKKFNKNSSNHSGKSMKSPELIAGSATIQKSIDDLVFEVGPDAFFQVNEKQTPILYAKARQYADAKEMLSEGERQYVGESSSEDEKLSEGEMSSEDEKLFEIEMLSEDERQSESVVKELMTDVDSDIDVSSDSNLDSDSKKTIVDLYCGVGTIGLSMSGNDNYIIGVESNKEAVLNANRNAVINSIVNARYFHGTAEDILPRLIADGIDDFKVEKIDLMVVDPPRAGCDKALLDAIGHVVPKRIVYVSCDPATLARDLAILCNEHGYKLERVCPVDMFPGSMNIEVVVRLSKLDFNAHKCLN